MRLLRRLFTASVLILTFALSAFAGEMSTPLVPPSAPQSATTEGEITTGVASNMSTTNIVEATAGDSVAGAAVGVVQSVLALF
ncbi:MAG: hypothetical protein QOC99_1491 [Acidobacteriota bacterium]|jgi:hypothetical protein|nr:hypothetical protein [Acidobacteriota bacterium]MDT7778979.1 hypothetical protein [Acidobacteriota bacterium]